MKQDIGGVVVAIGFDASSRHITVDGKPYGDPILTFGRVEAEGFDYQAEADKTNSPVWSPENVNLDDLRRNLQSFVDLAGILNLYKKLLFRGKNPEDLGMRTPEYGESVAGHGCAVPANEIDLVHGIIGNATEAGELCEILIDLLDGKAPDRVNAVEEVGDCRWYLNRVLRWADCTDLQCERINVDKLHGRHGTAFDIFRDANRDLGGERARLEQGVEPGPLVDMSKARMRCTGRCNHAPGTCTADPAYQAAMKAQAPTLPCGPHGDEPKPPKRRFMQQSDE
jgi:hypothetical protein